MVNNAHGGMLLLVYLEGSGGLSATLIMKYTKYSSPSKMFVTINVQFY